MSKITDLIKAEYAKGGAPLISLKKGEFDESRHQRDENGKFTDNAVVNLPLSQRGDIDAQIDRYKAGIAAEEKAKRKEEAPKRRSAKKEAKSLLEENIAAMIAKFGSKYPAGSLKTELTRMATWEPEKFIAFAEKFKAENK